jgi:hypothetical protein
MLAAGLLEDLLGFYGEYFMDRVEMLAEKDQRFNYLLGGVWQSFMSEEHWETVQRIRRTVW